MAPETAALSFEPRPRTTKTRGIIVATILLTVGAALVASAAWLQITSSPIRNAGHTAVGVLDDVTVDDAGESIGSFQYTDADTGESFTAVRRVSSDAAQKIGTTFRVFYDPAHPTHTWIENADTLEPPMPLYIIGGVLTLIGAAFFLRPPQTIDSGRSRSRTKR